MQHPAGTLVRGVELSVMGGAMEPTGDQVKTLVGQAIGSLSREKCFQLWQAISSGALGSGSEADAVRRGIAGRLNHQRTDHDQRLFISMFETVLVRDPRMLGYNRLPGALHFHDLSALWAVLREAPLAGMARNAADWLASEADAAPIYELLVREAALNLRENMRVAAVAALRDILRIEDDTNRFLEVLNNRRKALVCDILKASDLDYDPLLHRDLVSYTDALAIAPELDRIVSRLKLNTKVDRDPVDFALELYDQGDALARQVKGRVDSGVKILPALVALHKTQDFRVAGELLNHVDNTEREALAILMFGYLRAECGSIRAFWRFFADSKELPNPDRVKQAEKGIDLIKSFTDSVLSHGEFPGPVEVRRSVNAQLNQTRQVGLTSGDEALRTRLGDFLKSTRAKHPLFVSIRSLCALMRDTASMGPESLPLSPAWTDWQSSTVNSIWEAFRDAGHRLDDQTILPYYARTMELARALGGDPDSWIYISSIHLVRGAKGFFAEGTPNMGGIAQTMCETLALHAYLMAQSDSQQSKKEIGRTPISKICGYQHSYGHSLMTKYCLNRQSLKPKKTPRRFCSSAPCGSQCCSHHHSGGAVNP